MSHPLRALPHAYEVLLPELFALSYPDEARATCTTCAMAPKPGADPDVPWSFTHPSRCCTFHPTLANHTIGRILRRGGEGAERVRARVASREGLDASGISPPPEWTQRYRERARDAFGRDGSFQCPYWQDAPHGCTIWTDRNPVCRTWFCKHDAGPRGRAQWQATLAALDHADRALAAECVALGSPPGPKSSPREWEAWFRWCAERVDLLTDDEIRALRPAALDAPVQDARAAAEEPPMPDVLAPQIAERVRGDGVFFVSSYSTYDLTEVPGNFYAFAALLDGQRTWREALTEATAQGLPVTEGTLRAWWTAGLVGPADDAFRPGRVEFRGGPWADHPDIRRSITEMLTRKPIPDDEDRR